MSVVVRLSPGLVEACGGGSDVRIYVKGADSIMLTLLEPGSFGDFSLLNANRLAPPATSSSGSRPFGSLNPIILAPPFATHSVPTLLHWDFS